MTNGQSSRVIAASGTDRRIRLRRPAPAGTPPTAPGRQTPAAADRPRHGRRLRPRQTNPGHDRQTPAAADRPRPQQTDPGRSRQTPAAADRPRPQQTNPGTQQGSTPAKNAACRTGLPLRRSAVAGACHCSNQPPPPSIVTQAGRRSSRAPPRYPIAAPPAATQSDHSPGLPPLDRSPHKKTPRPRRDAAYRDADTGSPTPTRSLRAVWRRCRRLRG